MEKIGESVRPLLVGITGGLVAGILVLDMMLPLGLAGMLYVALAMISLWSPKRTFTLTVAGACTALILFDYHHAPPESETVLTIANRALALLAIWVTAILSLYALATRRISRFSGAYCPCARPVKRYETQGESGISSNSTSKKTRKWNFPAVFVRNAGKNGCPERRPSAGVPVTAAPPSLPGEAAGASVHFLSPVTSSQQI